MFTRDYLHLPEKNIKFDIIEDSKLEILVNCDELFDDVCQDILEVLESILEGSPVLTHFDELCIIYSFETRNRVCVLDLSLNK